MTFDVEQFLAKIEATVVPELPEELTEDRLRDHVAKRIAVAAVISIDGMKLRFIGTSLQGAQLYLDELLALSRYFARISGEKFCTYSSQHQDALELASMKVTRSVSILKTYIAILLKMQETVQARIDLRKK
jgi:hypothetical protein